MIARRLAVVAVVAGTLAWCAGPPSAELVVTNARVFTADPQRPWVEALAVRGERVIAAGDRAAVEALAAGATRRVDAGGRVVIPGFNDAHVRLDGPPSVARVRALATAAVERGATSLQLVSDTAVADTVAAVQGAGAAVRWRIVRSPVRLAGEWLDARTFLPPQPGPRIDVKGAAWQLDDALPPTPETQQPGDSRRFSRLPLEALATAIPWAYGPEDPIHVAARGRAAVEAYVAALEGTGLAGVWVRKRPRLEFPEVLPPGVIRRLASRGVVVVEGARGATPPAGDGATGASAGPDVLPLRALLAEGVPLALGSGGAPEPAANVAWVAANPRNPEQALTREQAVGAATRGAAFAEFTERDKGWLGAGALADFAVLSDDVFEAPVGRLPAIRSVLTVIGGTVAFDAGILR